MIDLRFATSSEIVREVGQRLRTQRLAKGITQAELASRAGVSVGSVKNAEATGKANLATIVCMAQALSLVMELSDLFAMKPQRSIAEMERSEGAVRKRAPRRRVVTG